MSHPSIHLAANTLPDAGSGQGVLLFLKAPERGGVKTRLACAIGPEAALEIYRNFVLDTLSMLKKAGRPTIICYTPEKAKKAVAQWLSGHDPFWPQTGTDLGERMAAAFARAFSENYGRVLLMGTDIPGLPASVIQEAFDALTRHPAVIGPALDGGYYMIGFTKSGFSPAYFQGIDWSTPRVFAQTIGRMRLNGVSCHILPQRRDIDDWEDLKDLISRREDLRFHAPLTLEFLESRRLPPAAGPSN